MSQHFLINSIIDNISDGINKFSTSWIYAGSLIFISVALTIVFMFFQFRRINAMRKSYFSTENTSAKKISPFKIFVSSLASRFGLGNVIGVGFAIVIGGPGVILWMIIVGMFSMAVALVESTLAQIYHEKDPNNKLTYRGGSSYYIYKGLGKSFKWLAIGYAIASIMSKGFFIIGSVSGTVANLGFFAFSNHYGNPSTQYIPPTSWDATNNWIVWAVVAFLVIFCLISLIGGVKKVLKITNISGPIIFSIFILFCVGYIIFNYKYVPDALKYIFIGFVNPKYAALNALNGATAWTLATTIKQGAIRGIFAHEAGQGSTTHFSAIPKVNHPIKMGYGQALGVFVDIAIICVLSGLFFTVAIIKFADLNHNKNVLNIILPGGNSPSYLQAWFTMWAAYNFLPHEWTMYLAGHGYGFVNSFFCFVMLFILAGATMQIAITAIVITEFGFIFLFRKKPESVQNKLVYIGRFIVPIGISLSPLLNSISKNVFSLADLVVAICFIFNAIGFVLLTPVVIKAYKNFNKQCENHADKMLKHDPNYIATKDLSFAQKHFPWFCKERKFLINRNKVLNDVNLEFEFNNESLGIKDKSLEDK